MHKKTDNIDRQMEQLEQLPRIEASPFFATRVEGRIETSLDEQQSFSFFSTPLRLAFLSLLLIVTLSVYTLHFIHRAQSVEEQSVAYFIEMYELDVEMHDLASIY